jgi:hypothetical protein
MHKLVKLSDAERRRIIHQFIDEAFGGLDANPRHGGHVALGDARAFRRSPPPSRSTPGSSWPNWSRTRTSRRASGGRPNTRRPTGPTATSRGCTTN